MDKKYKAQEKAKRRNERKLAHDSPTPLAESDPQDNVEVDSLAEEDEK